MICVETYRSSVCFTGRSIVRFGADVSHQGFNARKETEVSGSPHEQLLRHHFNELTTARISTRSGTFKLTTARTVLRRLLTDKGHLSLRLTAQGTLMLQALLDQHEGFTRVSDEPEWQRVTGAPKNHPIGQMSAGAA
jgi:hypothetical protein